MQSILGFVMLEVLLRAQQVSCDNTLEYFTYLEVPKMSFGKEFATSVVVPPRCNIVLVCMLLIIKCN